MRGAEIAAWAVHLYTALGTALGFLALEAVFRSAYGAAFAWMALATCIDSTDGALARRFRVKEVLPQFDGARLDDIVDYLNYVVVPMVLAYAAGLVPQGAGGFCIAVAPLLASAYGFCRSDAKTPDHFFTGFPSYWNVVVLYLYALRLGIAFNILILLLFSAMVFVPIRYLYPSRSPVARRRTYALGAPWVVLLLALLLQFPDPSRTLALISLYFPAYYLGMSFHVHFKYARARGSTGSPHGS